MPELYSRMDNANWLTPSIADILEQGANPPGGTGTIREYTLTLQRELSDLDTPARIVNVRSSPSYHLFVARPEMVGKMGNRRLVTPEEVEKSLEKIAENHPEWNLGFVPSLRGEDSAVGILLRTRDHRPQSLRRLLVRDTFRKHPVTTAFPCGITLEQQVIIRDFAEIGHLLIVGKDSARNHLIQSILLTLILLNTPAELRVAMAGHTARTHRTLSETPHALGRLLPDVVGGQRLLAGLIKEVQRRYQSFQEDNVRSFSQYNERQRDKDRPPLPRILMVIDSLSDDAWLDSNSEWLPLLMKLTAEGHKAGIHLILTVDDQQDVSLLKALDNTIYSRIVLRSAGKDLMKDSGIHRTQMRFIDAFVMDTRKEIRITPIEISAITAVEVKRAVEYWRNNARQRVTESTTSLHPVSGKTGVTGLLQTQEAAMVLAKPPIPEKPQSRALERAAQVLSAQQPPQRAVLPKQAPALDQTVETGAKEIVRDNTPDDNTVETPAAAEMPFTTETHPIPEKAVPAPEKKAGHSIEPSIPVHPAAHRPNGVAATALDPVENVATQRLSQSRTLAAYLGWLSPGALQDIFLISPEEATAIIDKLKQQHILEETTAAAPRFLPIIQKKED